MTAQDITDWVGRVEQVSDTLDLRPAALMESILPLEVPVALGSPLPPLWNWMYFHSPAPLDQLGRDGHPAKGGFLPPVDLPRRMWAGGRFAFSGALRIGDSVTRQSKILNVAPKTGKSGRLCFVTVEHCYQRAGQTVWREEHDIVYREDPAPGAAAPALVAAPLQAEQREEVTPSIVMLFRYSALTFNGHRIHYDRSYARDVEGYPDLVFHGPLTATLLADLARRVCPGPLRSFTYRAVSPLFDTDPFEICAGPVTAPVARGGDADQPGHVDVWACTPAGGLAMTARAEFA